MQEAAIRKRPDHIRCEHDDIEEKHDFQHPDSFFRTDALFKAQHQDNGKREAECFCNNVCQVSIVHSTDTFK